ncbi:MAG: hypothetical protein KAT79_03145 [candidate division Zixibacteria bacterium]|nr:hypothetical protein [candidate division Zixibacteria bacterium]
MAELYLVEFKGSRREFFFNSYYHALKASDWVITEAERGEDIGRLSKGLDPESPLPEGERPRSILRHASDEDVNKMLGLRQQEKTNMVEAAQMIGRHGLAMKVVDVECQFDGNKMTIFFTADHRVDFRELVKDLASRYRTRIELRQIGVRDEAKRIGGMGICGREQCCNAFIREFKPISTQHAREQNLPLNPAKISGNCGRLLCCLRFETELYAGVRKLFPAAGSVVKTSEGEGVIQRIDVFRREALVRTRDSVIRVGADDIEGVTKSGGRIAPVGKTIMDEYQDDAEGQGDGSLKDLDDKENSSKKK